ncbi:MAG: tetratricopeptide repeat protein, partial [Elusimicrobiota bacterium]
MNILIAAAAALLFCVRPAWSMPPAESAFKTAPAVLETPQAQSGFNSLRTATAVLETPQAQSGFNSLRTAQKHFLRGNLLQRRGEEAAAMEAYDQALAADPDSRYLCRQAAELALDMVDTDKALALARRLMAMDGREAKDQVLLGRVLWARDDVAGAQSAFEAALKLDPDSSDTILSLGTLLAERAPDQARKLLTRFLSKAPEEAAEAQYQLARIEFDAGHIGASIKHLKDGLAVEPESLPLRYALAQAYETQASTDAALAEYLEIARLEPNNAALLDRIGEIYFEKGEITEARARFHEARRAQPSDPFACQWLATDAERQGDWGR